jgi:hypothetical protein
MATAEIQTHTGSAARARKVWVVMRLLSDFPATMPGSIKRPKYANSRIASEFRWRLTGFHWPEYAPAPLDFREFPTTLSQRFSWGRTLGCAYKTCGFNVLVRIRSRGRGSALRKCSRT